MSIYVNNNFRIKRSASQQELMQKMIQAKIFSQYKDILMISAIIGYLNNRYLPIEKVASDGVLMQFFNDKDYNLRNRKIDKKRASKEVRRKYIKDNFKVQIRITSAS